MTRQLNSKALRCGLLLSALAVGVSGLGALPASAAQMPPHHSRHSLRAADCVSHATANGLHGKQRKKFLQICEKG